MSEAHTRSLRPWLVQSGFGLAAWLMAMLVMRPDMTREDWPRLALVLAALVYMPAYIYVLLSRVEGPWQYIEKLRPWIGISALLFAVSVFLPQGLWAGVLSFPWFCMTILLAWEGYIQLKMKGLRDPGLLSIHSGLLFLSIGGSGALADRLGLMPLGFSSAIIELTAIHFHFAGCFFPLLVGLAMQQRPHILAKGACYLAVISIPVTAIGITFVQLNASYLWEGIAGVAVALSGLLAALAYFSLAFRGKWPLLTRFCWSVLGICLLFSMSLAFLYAIRFWYPHPMLTIPWMRAWHGAANALGVAGMGLLGWVIIPAPRGARP